jgi:hypothetical protein
MPSSKPRQVTPGRGRETADSLEAAAESGDEDAARAERDFMKDNTFGREVGGRNRYDYNAPPHKQRDREPAWRRESRGPAVNDG